MLQGQLTTHRWLWQKMMVIHIIDYLRPERKSWGKFLILWEIRTLKSTKNIEDFRNMPRTRHVLRKDIKKTISFHVGIILRFSANLLKY